MFKLELDANDANVLLNALEALEERLEEGDEDMPVLQKLREQLLGMV